MSGAAAARLLGGACLAAATVDAVSRHPATMGVTAFGRPPLLAWAWVTLTLVVLGLLARRSDRLATARTLTLVLLVATLFGGRALPALPGARVALLGCALLAAHPWLGRTPTTLLALAVPLLALPAMLGSDLPQGSLVWVVGSLPYLGLLVLIPPLFPGPRALVPVRTLVLAVALAGLAALLSYPLVAAGLELSLGDLRATRLRVLGLHPNLGVPQLVLAAILGLGWVLTDRGRMRLLATAATGLVLVSLLAVQSRTGLLAVGLGAGLLLGLRLLPRLSPLARRALPLAVVVGLLVPATGLTDTAITHRAGAEDQAQMASKAVSFRAAMWELGRETWARAPWHGFGPGTLHVQSRHARPGRYDGLPKDDHPHNVVLAVGESLGWPGLVALAWLLLLTARWPRVDTPLAGAVWAAGLVVWSTHALDMGGAVVTLLPSVVLTAAGLGQALREEPSGDVPAPAPAGSPPVMIGGVVVVLFGVLAWTGQHTAIAAHERLAEDATVDDPQAVTALAGRLQPFDSTLPAAVARWHLARGQRDAALAALDRALALFPDSAPMLRQLAISRHERDSDDPSVRPLLERALELDPYGKGAWNTHLSWAVVLASDGEEEPARRHLMQALTMSPAALAALPYDATRRSFTLGGRPLPLDWVLAQLRAVRAEAADSDPARAVRALVREMDVLLLVDADDWERDDALDDIGYGWILAGRLAMARGDPAAAVEAYEHLDRMGFQTRVEEVSARSQVEPLDREAFERTVAQALEALPDVVFEAHTVARLLEARRLVAEREGQASRARELEAAVAFARS